MRSAQVPPKGLTARLGWGMRGSKWAAWAVAMLVVGLVAPVAARQGGHSGGHHGGHHSGWGGDGGWSGYSFTPYNEIIAPLYSDNRWLQAYGAQQAWAAQQRTSDILVGQSLARNQAQASQQYASQLWWRDHLERQLDRQNAQRASEAEADSASEPDFPSVIQWPSFLQLPQFTAGRANLEAPFRRVQAGGRPVLPIEYQAMVLDAQALKQQVEGSGTSLEPHEREAIVAFLDQLIAEATARGRQ